MSALSAAIQLPFSERLFFGSSLERALRWNDAVHSQSRHEGARFGGSFRTLRRKASYDLFLLNAKT